LHPLSPSTGQYVTELLYLLATLTLYFQRGGSLPSRPHYLLYQALYYYQNDWAYKPNIPTKVPQVKATGQQSLFSLGFSKNVANKTPTAEQLRIIQHPLSLPPAPPHLIKVVAFAGTGKTSTLVKLTEAHPNIKFLLVVYNKSVRIQAEAQFPKANVTCKTVHQMAMAKAGFMFAKKLTSNIKAKDILDSGLLEERGEDNTSLYRRAGQVQQTLHSFMNSRSSLEELEGHVPWVWRLGAREVTLTTSERRTVLRDCLAVWGAMQDKEDNRMRISHDGYLKVWQLRGPNLQWVKEHQVLLLDEGQDMNPAMLDIFLKQNTTRMIVGDPHQQIYMFRGAVNALDMVTPTHTYFLTQSFRFGPEIAFVANKCLKEFKGQDWRTLVGGKKVDTISGDETKPPKQLALIGRTNLGLFDQLQKLLFKKLQKEEVKKRIGLVGGVDSYNFEDYLDIHRLKMGKKEEMKKFKSFHSFTQLKSFAENVNDVELLGKIKVTEKYDVPKLIERIRSQVVKKIENADVVVSTVHKAKGLEFDQVVLLEDFPELLENYGTLRNVPEEEANLLYVAITRAKNSLRLNEVMNLDFLPSSRDTAHKIDYWRSCPEGVVCRHCSVGFHPSPHSLRVSPWYPSQRAQFLAQAMEPPAQKPSEQSQARGLCPNCSMTIFPYVDESFFSPPQLGRGVKRKRD